MIDPTLLLFALAAVAVIVMAILVIKGEPKKYK